MIVFLDEWYEEMQKMTNQPIESFDNGFADSELIADSLRYHDVHGPGESVIADAARKGFAR